MVDSVQRVNLLVRDLDRARSRFAANFGIQAGPVEALAERGEGVFLLSFGMPALAAAARRGLDGWRVIDADLDGEFGVDLQPCEEPQP